MKSYLLSFAVLFAAFTISCSQTKMVDKSTKAEAQKTKDDVIYVGHRGESCVAPENTMASFRLAWKVGADGAECDIHLTKDKRLVIMHDGNTKRTSGVDMVIKNSNSEDLRKLDIGSFKDPVYKGEQIPFLEEALSIIPEGKRFVIEVKCGAEAMPYLKKVVDDSGKKSQLIFISFNWDAIVAAKQTFPENRCYWLSSKKDAVYEKFDEVVKAGLDGLDLDYSIIDEELVKKANELHLGLIAWTVDDAAVAKRLISLGVKTLTTNRPDLLKKEVNGK